MCTNNISELTKRFIDLFECPTFINGNKFINVYYTLNFSYFESFNTLCLLAQEIKKDFPMVNEKTIAVKQLRLMRAGSRASVTALAAKIPYDEYLKFKESHHVLQISI